MRHGSLVYVTHTKRHVSKITPLYTWSKKDSVSIGKNSTQQELQILANVIASRISTPETVFIDYTFYSVYWGAQKMVSAKFAFFLGYLTSLLEQGSSRPLMVSPSILRKQLSLPPKAKKPEVWELVEKEYRMTQRAARVWDTLEEDSKDAATLGTVMYGKEDYVPSES